MLEIQSSKIVLTLVDTETGELFTAEEAFEEANDSCTNEARNSVMYGTQQNFSFNN